MNSCTRLTSSKTVVSRRLSPPREHQRSRASSPRRSSGARTSHAHGKTRQPRRSAATPCGAPLLPVATAWHVLHPSRSDSGVCRRKTPEKVPAPGKVRVRPGIPGVSGDAHHGRAGGLTSSAPGHDEHHFQARLTRRETSRLRSRVAPAGQPSRAPPPCAATARFPHHQRPLRRPRKNDRRALDCAHHVQGLDGGGEGRARVTSSPGTWYFPRFGWADTRCALELRLPERQLTRTGPPGGGARPGR